METVRSTDGTRIAFDRGRGPALMLVAPASATRMALAGVAAALAPDFTVYAYDRRGRGDSGDTPPFAVEREVDDLAALIDEAGGSAFVFGHSSGAVLSLEAARLLQPGKIKKLAMYEAPFIIDDSRPRTPPDFLARLNDLIAAGRREEAVELWNRNIGIPDAMMAGMKGSPWWPGLLAAAHTLPYDMTIMGDTQSGSPLPLRKWADVRVPTLVMDGTLFLGRPEGHGWMRHGADEIARILPNAQRRTLEGQDHGPSDEALAPALKEFFLG